MDWRFITLIALLSSISLVKVPLSVYAESLTQTTHKLVQSAGNYFDRASRKYENGDYRGALADFHESIRLKPDNANSYYNRGLVKVELGDSQGAINDWNKSIQLKSNRLIWV